MPYIWFYTISSVLLISLLSLIGIFSLSLKKNTLNKILFILVSFSAGSLLGETFIHLIPETEINTVSMIYVLLGIILFFVIEKIIHWRHCHIPTSQNHPHILGSMNLIGDSIHNFIDGAIIAGSFLISIPLGITTTIAVILHEIPQEIGDFGILLHAGYTRTKALFYNFFSAAFAILGALLILFFSNQSATLTLSLTQILIPFTAGGFIYISTADLIPELKKEESLSKSFLQLIAIIAGIGLMILLK